MGLALLDPGWPALIALVMVLNFAVETVVARNYVLALLFITPMALSISTFGLGIASTATMAGRWGDTLWGAAAALTVMVGAGLGEHARRLLKAGRG